MKTGNTLSFYAVLEDDPEMPYRDQVEHRAWFDLDDIFRAAAEDYFCQGGFESEWPLTFVLFNGLRGQELARAKVDLEYDPVFYCGEITEAP